MIRKFIIYLAIAGLLLTSVAPIAVAATGSQTIEVTYRDITIWVDGKQIPADTEPFLVQSRTFVPLRAIAEALGRSVSWDDPTNRVIIGPPSTESAPPDITEEGVVPTAPGSQTIEVSYRDISIWVDGKQISPDTEPFLVQSRTFVPLRAIAEALGRSVSWDDPTNRVIIGPPAKSRLPRILRVTGWRLPLTETKSLPWEVEARS